jgi:hypothetical protein
MMAVADGSVAVCPKKRRRASEAASRRRIKTVFSYFN